MLAQACTGSFPVRSFSLRKRSINAPRISGYFTRIGLYKYQE